MWDNNEPLQPFTINPTLRQIALPRDTTEASATVFSTNLSLVSRPRTDWRFSARVRHYGYENDTPHGDIPEFINYDTSVKVSSTGGPEPFAHSRTNFDADATWSGLARVALTAGYSHNEGSYDFRIFESSGEDVLRLTADATGTQWLTFRAQYETADKKGDGLNEALLTQIGEQPALRHYDIANRSRNRFTGQVDVVPNDLWIFSVSAGIGQDEYDDSYFGLQESTSKVYSISADYKSPNGFGVGTSYNYESYEGLQRSRSASPDRKWIRSATGRRTRPSACTTSRSTRRRRGSAATPKPGSPTTSATRAGTTSTRSCRAARCRRRRSCPRCSTSSSSSTST